MLTIWQEKFPQAFSKHSFSLETSEFVAGLSSLLTVIDQHELLDENTIESILSEYSFFSDELTALIKVLDNLDCLNHSTLHRIFAAYIPTLQESICGLVARGTVDKIFIQHFLKQNIPLNGLSRAITLFDLGRFDYFVNSYHYNRASSLFELGRIDYSINNFQQFCVLVTVLANPLCQTIFDARLRSYSDYAITREPIDSSTAKEIIHQLCALIDDESRIRVLFDSLVQFRPFPLSQKHIVEVDVTAKVKMALILHCESKISAIVSSSDYEQTRAMIKKLEKEGGDKTIFNQIKYSIGSAIESEDWCSTRSYDQLMNEIEQVLIRPLIKLCDFTDQLENSTGYRQSAGLAIRWLSPLMASAAMDEESAMDVNDSNQFDLC